MSQTSNNNQDVQNIIDEYDKMTADSQIQYQASPSTNHNYLESKFFNAKQLSPRVINYQASLTTVKSMEKIDQYQQTQTNNIQNNNKTNNNQKQKCCKRFRNENTRFQSSDLNYKKHIQIQPALIELNSTGHIDTFNRHRLLFFKPTPKNQDNYDLHNVLSEQNFNTNFEQLQENNMQETQNNNNQSSQMFEIPNQFENPIINSKIQNIVERQTTENLNMSYRRSFKNKQLQKSFQQQQQYNRISYQNNSQDLKLTKYLSPMKQQFRIVYKDNTEHKHQQKYLKQSFFNTSKDQMIKNEQINQSTSHLNLKLQNSSFQLPSNSLKQLLLSPQNNLNNKNINNINVQDQQIESKQFVQMLKQYKHKRQEIFHNQIKSQSRDIDNLFRNHNHQDPQQISLRESVMIKQQKQNDFKISKNDVDANEQVGTQPQCAFINRKQRYYSSLINPKNHNNMNNTTFQITNNQHQLDLEENNETQDFHSYDQTPKGVGLEIGKGDINNSPQKKKQRVISQLNSNNTQIYQQRNRLQRMRLNNSISNCNIQQKSKQQGSGDISQKMLMNQQLISQYIINKQQNEYSPFFNPEILTSLNDMKRKKNNKNSQQNLKISTPQHKSDVNDISKNDINISELRTPQNQQVLSSSAFEKQNQNLNNGNSTNDSNSQQIQSLLRRKRRDRFNFEKEKLLALAVPGYIDYIYNF